MKKNNPTSYITSTPLSSVKRKKLNQKSGRSTYSLGSERSDKSPTNILFEMVMRDPKKRDVVEKLVRENRGDIEEYKRKEARKNLGKNKRVKKLQKMLQYESPTALLRRRALEDDRSSNSSSSITSFKNLLSSTSELEKRPFEKLLLGVIGYVEIHRQGKDCSAGAKVLMQAMGATVNDRLSPEVTHVVFKDGSYNTFKTAKLLKIHVVSVLWLEAVRKSSSRVPEKNYPALGTEYENISQICQDYESIINEEYCRSLNISSQNVNNYEKCNTAIPNELEPPQEIEADIPIEPNKRRVTEVIPSSQAWEAESVISYESGYLPVRRIATISNEGDDSFIDLLSDSDSDCGTIDGHSFKRSSQPSQLDISLNAQNETEKTVDNINNSSENIASSQSVSLLSKKSIQNQKSNFHTNTSVVDMELTKNLDNSSNNKENISNLKKKRLSVKINNDNIIQSNDKLFKESYVDLSLSNEITPTLSLSTESQTNRKSSKSSRCSKQRSSSNSGRSSHSTKSSEGVQNQKKSSLYSEDVFSLKISSNASNNETCSNNRRNISRSSNTTSTSSDPNKKESIDGTSLLTEDTSTNTSKKSESQQNVACTNNSDERISLISLVDTPEPDNQEHPINKEPAVKNNESSRISITHLSKVLSITRSKDDSFIPNKKIKINQPNVSKSERKPTRLRKLYNLNQSIDEEAFEKWYNDMQKKQQDKPTIAQQNEPEVTTSTISTSKINEIIKALDVPLTPIKTTAALIKQLHGDDKKSKIKKTQKSQKKPKTTTRKVTKQVQLDNSKDEQKKLIDEFVNKKKPNDKNNDQSTFKKPINRRLFTPGKTKHGNEDNTQNNNNTLVPLVNRRSTLDFAKTPPMRPRRRLVHKIKNPSIVCTRLHRDEVENFVQIVKKLGYFFVENEVTHKTTHLVVGESKRTINLLRAIARGCWIVTKEWLFKSLEASKWLPEEDFELPDFSPAIQQCRMQREAFGPLYSMDIFANCGPIYVGYNTIPRRSDLQELIELCNGVLTNVSSNASIVIGDFIRYEGVTCVTEKWVLDSVTFNKKKPFRHYIMNETS